MARYELTIDQELVHGLFRGDEGLARLLEEVLNQVLESQATEHLQAGPYERTDSRRGYRNGHRSRVLKTGVGALNLSVPRLRDGEFCTELFQRYQRSEQALVLALMELVSGGVSTTTRPGLPVRSSVWSRALRCYGRHCLPPGVPQAPQEHQHPRAPHPRGQKTPASDQNLHQPRVCAQAFGGLLDGTG